MNVGIIGCGLIGQKRARALANCRLVACADSVQARAKSLSAGIPKAVGVADWREVVNHPDIDIVIVSATNNVLAEITLAAVRAGKHVLVEKPAACRAAELDAIIKAAKDKGVAVRVGFNHRFHPALSKAKAIIDAGELGELMFLRGRYGHGGRLGYDKEWRANPEISGGGELLDQGVHLIDLSRWFLGEFPSVEGFATTYFWDMPVEDNGFLLLRTAKNQAAFLQVSCTEWKNMFCLEIYGQNGKLQIDGLGGSYGVERLTHYRMLPQMGPPQTTAWEYPMGDDSWALEFKEFLEDIRNKRQPTAGLNDARAALEIVETIYKVSGLI